MLMKFLTHYRQWGPNRLGSSLTIRCLRKELPRSLPDLSAKQRQEVFAHIRKRTPEIVEMDESWYQDIPSRSHLEWAASVLAAYEVIRPMVEDEDEAVDLLGRSNLRGWSSWFTRYLPRRLPQKIRESPEAIRRVMNVHLSQYGMPWQWRASTSDDGALVVTLRYCFYFSFMRSHGKPHLTAAFDRINSIWIDRIDPNKHGFRLDTERQKSLVKGDECCCFALVPTTVSRSGENRP